MSAKDTKVRVKKIPDHSETQVKQGVCTQAVGGYACAVRACVHKLKQSIDKV
jgi:hypothetical protein